jgi:hypothetical protein
MTAVLLLLGLAGNQLLVVPGVHPTPLPELRELRRGAGAEVRALLQGPVLLVKYI